MKKKIYTSPRIYCIQLDGEDNLLLDASDPSRNKKEWTPEENGSTINIIEEGDGNLGDPDSEISGAKSNKFSWDTWD